MRPPVVTDPSRRSAASRPAAGRRPVRPAARSTGRSCPRTRPGPAARAGTGSSGHSAKADLDRVRHVGARPGADAGGADRRRGRTSRGGRGDGGAADDPGVVVEHDGLPGRDPVAGASRTTSMPSSSSVRGGRQRRRRGPGAGPGRTRLRSSAPSVQVGRMARMVRTPERLPRPDRDGVGHRRDVQHVPRPAVVGRHAEPQAAALADGELVAARVVADRRPRLVDDLAGPLPQSSVRKPAVSPSG